MKGVIWKISKKRKVNTLRFVMASAYLLIAEMHAFSLDEGRVQSEYMRLTAKFCSVRSRRGGSELGSLVEEK